jgi:hypothetical protein
MLTLPVATSARAASLALLLSTALIGLAACGGSDSTGPQTAGCGMAPLGTMTASVNGQPFSATLAAQATIQNGTALGANIVQVNGVECGSAGAVGRQILFTVGRLTPITPGTYQLSAASQQLPAGSGYSGIGQVTLAPNLWYANGSDAAGPGSGSITFTTVTATRLAGTFQLNAVANAANAAGARERMIVTNGAFDVRTP